MRSAQTKPALTYLMFGGCSVMNLLRTLSEIILNLKTLFVLLGFRNDVDEISILNGIGHCLTGYLAPDVSGLCNSLILLDFRLFKMRPLICLTSSATKHPATLRPVLKPVFGSGRTNNTQFLYQSIFEEVWGSERYSLLQTYRALSRNNFLFL
jgi:hypothetical protein